MIPKLRIAAELAAAPGWIPIVAIGNRVAYRADVLLWVAPQPNSDELAREITAALNGPCDILHEDENSGVKL